MKRLPLSLFLGLCFNLILASLVFATTNQAFTRSQAYWLGMLGLVTITLSIYLFFVMFLPEKF